MAKKVLVRKNRTAEPPHNDRVIVSMGRGRDNLITNNLDSEFRSARRGDPHVPQRRSPTVNVSSLPGNMQSEMKRRAQGGGAQGVFGSFFSPFRIRPSIESPTKRKDLNEWYRYYFKHDPIVGTAIDLHSTFPLSRFSVEHDDPEVAEFFNDMVEELNLQEFLIQMSIEYFVVGEAFPFGFLDDVKDPTRWTKFILLDPDKIRINHHVFASGEGSGYTIKLQPDADLLTIVERGPNDPATGPLFKALPGDIIEYVKQRKDIPLDPLQASHFKRSTNYLNVRGESILSRIIQDLMYLDKLRDAQWAIADRHITPKEFYLIGEPDNPADDSEIAAFQSILATQWQSPNQAYVWHHAVKIQWEGASGRILPLQPEFDFIERRILSGLGINKSMLSGEGPSYSNASVAMDVLIGRYMLYREKMEQWLLESVFKPLCRMHGIYKTSKKEVSNRIKMKKRRKLPDLPRISWDKSQLRDEMTKIMLYERLVQQGIIPRKQLYSILNMSPKQMREEFYDQKKEDLEDQKKVQEMTNQMSGGQAGGNLPSMGGPGGMPGGLGGLFGGGGGPAGGMGAPTAGLPGGTLGGGPGGLSMNKPLPGAPGGSPAGGITSPMGGGPMRPPGAARPPGT